jgi:Na+/citrate or Na+/malate symporter
VTTGNTIKAFLCATAAVATVLSVGAFAGAKMAAFPVNAAITGKAAF